MMLNKVSYFINILTLRYTTRDLTVNDSFTLLPTLKPANMEYREREGSRYRFHRKRVTCLTKLVQKVNQLEILAIQ